MAVQSNPYPLRIERDVMEKIKVIAKNNGRSVNKEIEFVLRKHTDEYEKQHGIVNLDE